MGQAVIEELDDVKTAAEEEAADLAASLADTIAELEATQGDLQMLQETTVAMGSPVASPEVVIGYPLYMPVRSLVRPALVQKSACLCVGTAKLLSLKMPLGTIKELLCYIDSRAQLHQ